MSESMALNFVDSWMSDFVLDGAGRVFMIVCLAVLGAILGSFMKFLQGLIMSSYEKHIGCSDLSRRAINNPWKPL